MDNGGSNKKKRGEKQMVKYYFQSMNGSLSFVHAGKKEFGADKDEVKARIQAQIDEAEEKLKNFLAKTIVPDDEKEKLENELKIATLRKGIYDAKQELARVDDLMKADLVFFELTPVELDID